MATTYSQAELAENARHAKADMVKGIRENHRGAVIHMCRGWWIHVGVYAQLSLEVGCYFRTPDMSEAKHKTLSIAL